MRGGSDFDHFPAAALAFGGFILAVWAALVRELTKRFSLPRANQHMPAGFSFQRCASARPIRDFHKKIRADGGGQEKSERMNSERTKAINATACGASIS